MIQMTNKVLTQQIRQLENDINVAVSNLKTHRELEDLFYQTEKAISYVFYGDRSGTDKYFALLDVINEVDEYSAMDLRDNFFVGSIDDLEMKLKLKVLLFIMLRKLLLKVQLFSDLAI